MRGRRGRPWSRRAGDEEARRGLAVLIVKPASVLLTGKDPGHDRQRTREPDGWSGPARDRAAKADLSQDIDEGKVVPPGITGTDPQRSGP